MPKSTLALKATVTRRPAVENVATTEQEVPTAAPEPAQSQDLEPAPEPEGSPAGEAEAESTPSQERSRTQRKWQEQREAHAVQSAFLAGNLNKLVVIFLVTGLRLTGKLRQYDQFTVLLEGRDGISSMVFKHAVSAIAPAR